MTDADRLRTWLAVNGRSQRGLARELGLNERTIRYYCSNEQVVPKAIWLALETLSGSRQALQSPEA